MVKFLIALAVQPLCFLICDAIINGSIYICQEINHSIRKIKGSVRETVWDIEWHLKLMRGK